jgi:hypothetical protein
MIDGGLSIILLASLLGGLAAKAVIGTCLISRNKNPVINL